MSSLSAPDRRLGFSEAEKALSPYAPFFKERMAPLPAHVREALLMGAQAHEMLPPVQAAKDLQKPGYWPVETGYSLSPDGAVRVFVLTQMPGVTPAMWDWWFAWHGSHAQRYKLWHPQAHVHAAWQDGRSDLSHYVGRVSKVVEYVGPTCLDVTVAFVPPAQLGLNEQQLAADGEVAICASGGMAGTPLETGWLIHHLRPVPGGTEMRSRFWLGGDNVRARGILKPLGAVLGRVARRLQPLTATQGAELLVHCSQEMNHLAAILPALHTSFHAGTHPNATR